MNDEQYYNEEELPFEEGQTTDTIPSELVPVEVKPALAFMEKDELPDLDAMDEGMNLAPTYWEAEQEGDTKRVVLIGWSEMNSKQGGKTKLAVLQNREGIWVIAGTNLVQQLSNVSYHTPLQITYNGKEKTGNGNQVKKFTVKKLEPKPAAPTAPSMTHLSNADPVKRGRQAQTA